MLGMIACTFEEVGLVPCVDGPLVTRVLNGLESVLHHSGRSRVHHVIRVEPLLAKDC